MRIREGLKYDFKDLLLVPQRSGVPSRANVELSRKFTFPHSKRELVCIPLIAANMSTVGTFAMAKALAKCNILTALHKYYSIEQLADFFLENTGLWDCIFYTVGTSKEDYDKLITLKKIIANKTDTATAESFPHLLCIDVANGYTGNFISTVEVYRKTICSQSIILAGNVVTSNIAEELILHGADIVKVGIGSGSVCTTRLKTGVGYPQLSAIAESSFVVHGKPNGHICSDGGIIHPGDVSKALAAGADFVMIGGGFAGTDECEGDWELDSQGKRSHLKFFGMSSKDAQDQFNGGLATHRSAEGKTVKVKYKGSISDVVIDILGGVRSTCTYVGAERIKDLPKCAEFIHVARTHNNVFGE